MNRCLSALSVTAVLAVGLLFGAPQQAAAHHEKARPSHATLAKIYPGLVKPGFGWKDLEGAWDRTHPAAARRHAARASTARIDALVRRAQAWPIGVNPATGNWHVNGAAYALFAEVLRGPDVACARTISGRETGGTYSHRVGYGFTWDNPGNGRAYGIGQALPASKMLPWSRPGISIYQDPVGQIRWMKAYADGRYGSLCGALSFHLQNGWW